jgi:hypothetical protein
VDEIQKQRYDAVIDQISLLQSLLQRKLKLKKLNQMMK